MSYFVIGVGGSGARSIESLIHLCAAGLLDNKNLYFIFIDLDIENGNINRTFRLYQKYELCRRYFNPTGENGNFLKTGIQTLPISNSKIDDSNISEFIENRKNISESSKHIVTVTEKTEKTLRDMFNYTDSSFGDNRRKLFDLLYKKNNGDYSHSNVYDGDMQLHVGFNGSPSVGAPIMEKFLLEYDEKIKNNSIYDYGKHHNWHEFINLINTDKDNETRVILVGSIFGGTGASSISVIGKWLKTKFDSKSNLKIGASIILPYFSYNDEKHKHNVNAKSQNFWLKSKIGLEYFSNEKIYNTFDAIYLTGENPEISSDLTISTSQNQLPNGGKSQENLPHYIDLYAAYSILSFFKLDKNSFNNEKIYYIGRQDKNKLEWEDFENIQKNLSALIILSYIYLKEFYKYIDKDDYGWLFNKAPVWFTNHNFPKKDQKNRKDILIIMKELNQYCQLFLYWIGQIHCSNLKKNQESTIEESIKINFIVKKRLEKFLNYFYLENSHDRRWWRQNQSIEHIKYDFSDILSDEIDKFIVEKIQGDKNVYYNFDFKNILNKISSIHNQNSNLFANNLFKFCTL